MRPEADDPVDAAAWPSSSVAIRSWNEYAITAGTIAATYWVRPSDPTPITLPASSSNGLAALRTISITRLLFSSATDMATHWPYRTIAMNRKITRAWPVIAPPTSPAKSLGFSPGAAGVGPTTVTAGGMPSELSWSAG